MNGSGKHRGRTNPKVTHITINDGSDGVEADKARAGVGVVGTRADWERVKTKTQNLIRDKTRGGRGKELTLYRTTQPSECRVHTKPLKNNMSLNVWYAWWARRGHPFQEPGVGSRGVL